jgi:hypothetical protein
MWRIYPCVGKTSWVSTLCTCQAAGRRRLAAVAHLSKAGVRRYSLVTDKMALIRLSVDRGGRLLLVGHFKFPQNVF